MTPERHVMGEAGARIRASGARLRAMGPEAGAVIVRGVGVPALAAIGLGALGSSIYFALGVVAKDALGLTPVAFLVAGVFFVLTAMTYVEGNALHPERGGASTLARYAFNELWSFVAGWAMLLDYLIVMAIAAFSVSHYAGAFWAPVDDTGPGLAIVALVLAYVALVNVRGVTAEGLRLMLRVALANVALLLVLVVVGLVLLWDPGEIAGSIELGVAPRWEDLVVAVVIAMVALTGIEAASGLASEIRVGRAELRRVVAVGWAAVLAAFVGISVVALMALPVVGGETALGTDFVEAPVLGVVSGFDPGWLRELARHAVGAAGVLVLVAAVNGNMLGLSRLAYSLATNRQIPSAVGRLHPQRSTPHVATLLAAVLALALALSQDIVFLVGIFAFGAMLVFTLAHLSVIVLRFREPDLPRAYRIPLSVGVAGRSLPLPAVAGALVGLGAWVSVIAFHEGARLVGGAWMVAGLALYAVYRRGQGKSLTGRFTVPAAALQKDLPGAEYGSILVPVFGTPLDDEIMGTAGRLAAEEAGEGEGGALIEAIYVIEMPMALPLEASVPGERVAAARRALARAKEVGEEYEGVEVATATSRARSAGAAIVEEARRRGVEAIVLAAEQPTRVRGGALLGGRGGGPRDRYVGEMTRYVIEKAPCRVVLTAAPAGEERPREGVRP